MCAYPGSRRLSPYLCARMQGKSDLRCGMARMPILFRRAPRSQDVLLTNHPHRAVDCCSAVRFRMDRNHIRHVGTRGSTFRGVCGARQAFLLWYKVLFTIRRLCELKTCRMAFRHIGPGSFSKSNLNLSMRTIICFVVRCSTRRLGRGLPVLLGRFLPKLGPSRTALFFAGGSSCRSAPA